MSFVIPILSIVVLILLILYYASTYKHNYWKKKKVPHLKPLPAFGNYADFILLKKSAPEVVQDLCKQFPDEPYFGTYLGTEPTLVLQDPDIIKVIFTKDFYYFNSRETAAHNHKEVTTQNLFFAHGDKWKVLRQNLTPIFTSAKMRNMFYLIEKCSHVFEDMLDYEVGISNVLDARFLMNRYTMDCIGICAFGVETKTMEKQSGTPNPFTHMGYMIFNSSMYRGFKNVARSIWPAIFYTLNFRSFPLEIDYFFNNLMTKVFESRDYKPSKKNDFVDLVLGLKQNKYIVGDSMSNMKTGGGKKVQLEVDNDLLVAQCIVLFAAGYETSATTLSFTLYELAKNKEAQIRAQQEVDEFLARHNNKLNYDCVSEMPYLEACVSETLRLYPVLGVLARELMENYTLPTGLKVEKGVRVQLPVYHLHRDPRLFPEPESYKPERFLPENKHLIKPCTYFPFGEGPRYCIGKRFANMQVTSGLISVLKKFNLELAEGTPSTVEFETTTLLIQPTCELNVKLTPRDGWEQRIFAK